MAVVDFGLDAEQLVSGIVGRPASGFVGLVSDFVPRSETSGRVIDDTIIDAGLSRFGIRVCHGLLGDGQHFAAAHQIELSVVQVTEIVH